MTKDIREKEVKSVKEQMEESLFTRTEYDRTRGLPKRIKQTIIGKRAIQRFIKSTDARFKAELSKKDYQVFRNNPNVRYQHLLFMVMKYMLNREIDIKVEQNSGIVQIGMLANRESDDEIVIIHNFMNPGMYDHVSSVITNAKRVMENDK